MTVTVVDRAMRGRESGVSEGADGNCNQFRCYILRVPHGRTAARAEAELEHGAVISRAPPDLSPACRRDPIPWPAGLYTEGAAGAPLARVAVTDSDSCRLPLDRDSQLPAGTRRRAGALSGDVVAHACVGL